MGIALSVTPRNGKFHRKSGLVRNQKKKVPIVPSASVDAMSTRQPLRFSSAWARLRRTLASTNGERNMRPRGRVKVEKEIRQYAQSSKRMENSHRKSGLVRNEKNNVQYKSNIGKSPKQVT